LKRGYRDIARINNQSIHKKSVVTDLVLVA
jgi:hypothetical protein